MKVQCPYCNTPYQLDDKKIPDRKIKFKCRKCQKPVYVKKEIQPPEKKTGKEKIVDCPKCSYGLQPDDLECPKCGIVIEKYEAYLAKKKRVESEASDEVGEDEASSPLALAAEKEEIDKQNDATLDRITCKACTQEISADVNFCPHCGQPAKSGDNT